MLIPINMDLLINDPDPTSDLIKELTEVITKFHPAGSVVREITFVVSLNNLHHLEYKAMPGAVMVGNIYGGL